MFQQKKARVQSTLKDRMERANDLMKRILALAKPPSLENAGTMMDSCRIMQTLVNTRHIESHEQEAAAKTNAAGDPAESRILVESAGFG